MDLPPTPGSDPGEANEVFQHYRILRHPDGRLWELGRGAMGITYKALDTNLRAPVALKLVRGSLLPDARARERFLREARAAAQLRHSHVATVYHLGEEAGACFYTMEFLDGETAEQLVRRAGPLDTLTALRMAAQVARALQAAHSRGMLHRDLKPSNLMVLHEEGELLVKVIDFGLVKSLQVAEEEVGAGASLSQGLFQGTPLYASPEQCSQDESIDGRSDLYSLGATLWHLLAGNPPFQGTARTVVAQHLTKPPPFETLSNQPPAVVGLLRELLAKDPADRPADAAVLRARLKDILQNFENPRPAAPPPPLPAVRPATETQRPPPLPPAAWTTSLPAIPPPPPPVRVLPVPLPPPSRRGKRPTALIGAAVASLLILTLLLGWVWHHLSSSQSPVIVVNPKPTPSDTDPASAEVAAGKEAMQRGDPEAALAAFQRGQRLNAQSPGVVAGLREVKNAAERLAQEGSDLQSKDPVGALEKNRLAATLGSPRGQNALADQYDAGRGTARDYAQSLSWYRRAAEAGFAPAQANLGYAIANGRGIVRDDTEAVRWYRLAAAQGNTLAQTELGYFLSIGRGAPRDEAQAAVWDRKSAEQGNALGQLNLAKLMLAGRGVPKDPEEAARWLRKSADQGNTTAQDYLGDLYLNGNGVPADDAQALFWYRKAAEKGNAVAQNDLGFMYQRGRGVPADDVQAAEWYQKSADNGDASGQNNLGFFYENGRGGLAKDVARAATLYRRSAEQGNAFAQCNFGLMLAGGRGVKQDDAEAVTWYRKAAEQGNAVAQVELGYHLATGRGVTRDDAQAVEWYRKGAAQGNETGRNNLGFMMENGRGTPRDLPGAIALYRQSASGGFPAAAGNLGNLYSEGRGVPRDDAEAIRWWKKGAAGGDTRCQNSLRSRGLTW